MKIVVTVRSDALSAWPSVALTKECPRSAKSFAQEGLEKAELSIPRLAGDPVHEFVKLLVEPEPVVAG